MSTLETATKIALAKTIDSESHRTGRAIYMIAADRGITDESVLGLVGRIAQGHIGSDKAAAEYLDGFAAGEHDRSPNSNL